MDSRIEYAFELLEPRLSSAIKSLGEETVGKIDEIRLRTNRELSLSTGSDDIFSEGVTVTAEDIDRTFKAAFSYSLHSFSRELSEGYITVRGGNRVGICGTLAPADGARGDTMKYISSVNIRIAREIKGCAEGIFSECFADGPCGLLVIGPPSSGKTTLLRDLSRLLGGRYKVSLIDERNEISASLRGVPQNDVGKLTDVFSGYEKPKGISAAVRVMSPRVIIADEIGTRADCEALEYAHCSGVALVTAVHGLNLSDAENNPDLKRLIGSGAFKWAAELSQSRVPRVTRID